MTYAHGSSVLRAPSLIGQNDSLTTSVSRDQCDTV